MKRLVAYWQRLYRRLTLSQIIWISFTVTTMIASLLTGMSFFERLSGQMQQIVQEETQSIIEQVGNTCASYVRNMMRVSDSLYYTVIKKNDIGESQIDSALQLMYDTNKDNVESIALFSTGGELLAAAPAARLDKNTVIKNTEWYKAALNNTENMHFTSPEVSHLFATSDSEYNWVIPLGRAVQITKNNHVVQGVLLINLRYSAVQDIFDNVAMSNGAYIYVTRADGEILYHPHRQLILSGQMKENNSQAVRFRDGVYKDNFDGEVRQLIVKTVGYTGWKVIGVVPNDDLTLNNLKSQLFVVFLVLFFACVLVMVNSFISQKVTRPIRQLEESVKGLEEGNWDTEIRVGGFYEVRHLGKAINNMARHIKLLMSDIVIEHEAKRKSELMALQNQINPHFLYNTLDIIVWMIENERGSDASRIVTALARFFRISLSKGRNIITVEDELEHVRNYLAIQEVRFKNRFCYRFDIANDVLTLGTIKLVLQPIVENAIYHAMEFMDGDGEIVVKAWQQDGDLKYLIKDNGCGMTEETLEALLNGKVVRSSRGSGVGLHNVIERIQLMFGPEYGVEIVSEPDEGTEVYITQPAVAYERLKGGDKQ